jgi:signal peptidase I
MTVIINNTAFWGRDPERGAIVVMDSPTGRVYRRVVGLPGETVAMRDNWVVANGKRPGLRITRGPGIPDWGPVQLGADQFFVLAQNPDAADSRTWGPITRDQLYGVATFYFTDQDRSWNVVDPTPTPVRPPG